MLGSGATFGFFMSIGRAGVGPEEHSKYTDRFRLGYKDGRITYGARSIRESIQTTYDHAEEISQDSRGAQHQLNEVGRTRQRRMKRSAACINNGYLFATMNDWLRHYVLISHIKSTTGGY
jgi:hypothetical protein